MERKITGSLIYLTVQNCLPFSIVETEAFKQFLHVTCLHYQVPCATTITNMIDRKFERLFEIEKKRLANIKNFSLTTNAWTASHSLASIFGITGHYINNNGVLSSVVLGVYKII